MNGDAGTARVWDRAAIEALGPVTDVPTTASVLGANEWTVYESIRRGTWTLTRVLRLGRKIKIPTHDLIALLYGAAPTVASPAAGGPAHGRPAGDVSTGPAASLHMVPSPCHLGASPQDIDTEPHTTCGCRAPSNGPQKQNGP